jgi:hypothetical protein
MLVQKLCQHCVGNWWLHFDIIYKNNVNQNTLSTGVWSTLLSIYCHPKQRQDKTIHATQYFNPFNSIN